AHSGLSGMEKPPQQSDARAARASRFADGLSSLAWPQGPGRQSVDALGPQRRLPRRSARSSCGAGR
ncbi:hypothetical protein P7K49_007130, partial [Saguinus oedipus]